MRGISRNVLVLGLVSLLFGALWQWYEPLAAFGCGAVLAGVAALLLLLLVPTPGASAKRRASAGAA